MMMDNDFQKLGMRLKVFAILTLLSTVLGFVPFVSTIASFLSFPLLIFQILIIVGAKKCATSYKNNYLNLFGTLMIVSMVTSFASFGLIFAMTFVQVMGEMMGGGSGIINILPIMVAGEVVSLVTLVFELVAWFYMLGFFEHLEEVDARVRGKPGALLVLVGSSIAIASSLIVGIPTAINNPVVDIENLEIVMPLPLVIASTLFGLATAVLSAIGYLILSQVFTLLGDLRPKVPRFPTPSTATSWAGGDPYGSPPPGAWDGDERPMGRDPSAIGAPGTRKCPFCGATLFTDDPRAGFCGECGAKIPGQD